MSTCSFNLTKCYSVTHGRDLSDELTLVFTDDLAAPIDLTGIVVSAQIFSLATSKVIANFISIRVEPLLGQVVLKRLSWLKKPTAGEAYAWTLFFDNTSRLRGNANIYAY